ncbi:hypothetical protein [Methylophilus sp.]
MIVTIEPIDMITTAAATAPAVIAAKDMALVACGRSVALAALN